MSYTEKDRLNKAKYYKAHKTSILKKRKQYYNRIKHTDEWKEYHREYSKNHRGTISGRANHLFCTIRLRSKRRNIEFSLTKQWVVDKLQSGKCEVTGIPFDFSVGVGLASFSPSIDRIDPFVGYIPSNCRMVVTIFNNARGAWPKEEFDRMVEAYIKCNKQHVAS